MTAEEAAGCDISVMKTFYPHTICGEDKLKRPILWEMDGKINAQAIVSMTTREGLLGYHFWTMQTKLDEKFIETSEKAEMNANFGEKDEEGGGETSGGAQANNDTATVFSKVGLENSKVKGHRYSKIPLNTLAIMDMTDFGAEQCSKMCLDQVKLFVTTDNVCYPETLGKMLVINAPWLVTTTWNIIKGWLDVRTVDKIEIISPEDSMARLRDFIEEDQIPAKYGGKGPELYFPHKNCEFLWLARGGDVSKTFEVPVNKAVILDSYLAEGPVEVTISSYPCTDDGTDDVPKKEERRLSFGFLSSFTSASTPSTDLATVHVDKHVHTPKRGEESQRFKRTISFADDKAHKVVVTWKNLSLVSRRSLVYAFTVVEPSESSGANFVARPSLTHEQSEEKSDDAGA